MIRVLLVDDDALSQSRDEQERKSIVLLVDGSGSGAGADRGLADACCSPIAQATACLRGDASHGEGALSQSRCGEAVRLGAVGELHYSRLGAGSLCASATSAGGKMQTSGP